MYKLVISGTLPGLNQIISAACSSRYKYNSIKRQHQHMVEWQIQRQLKGVEIKHQCDIHFTFYERNKMRDYDNISSGARKIILDALQTTGVLKGDGWRDIRALTESFDVDRDNPRIEVEID